MKNCIISLLLVVLTVCFPSELHSYDYFMNTEGYINSVGGVDIDVARALVDVINSIERARIERCYVDIDEMQSKSEKGDTVQAEHIFSLLPKELVTDEYLVVVNEKYHRKGPGFTIFILPDDKDRNELGVGGLWPVDRVRKYGRLSSVLGYKVLLVDLESGRDFFSYEENYHNSLNISEETAAPLDLLTEDSGRVFIYNDVDGRLVNVSGNFPITEAIRRNNGIQYPRTE